MQICVNCLNCLNTGNIYCVCGKDNVKYRSPVTGKWRYERLPLCKDINKDGKCPVYQKKEDE